MWEHALRLNPELHSGRQAGLVHLGKGEGDQPNKRKFAEGVSEDEAPRDKDERGPSKMVQNLKPEKVVVMNVVPEVVMLDENSEVNMEGAPGDGEDTEAPRRPPLVPETWLTPVSTTQKQEPGGAKVVEEPHARGGKVVLVDTLRKEKEEAAASLELEAD